MNRSLLPQIRALAAAVAQRVARRPDGRRPRIVIPDSDERLDYSADERAALEAARDRARDAQVAAGQTDKRIFIPSLPLEQA